MKTAPSPSISLTAALLLLALAAVWGGSFFFAEVALREVPPLTIALHRVVWAVPVLFLVVRIKGIRIPTDIKTWGFYLVMGALNNAIPFSLIFWGQTHISSGLASILNGMTAVFGAVVAGVLLADEPLTPGKIVGGVFGVAGVAAIMGPGALRGLDPSNLCQLAILGGALSYAFASVWGKKFLSGQPPIMNALGMLTGAVVLMVPVAINRDGVPTFALSVDIWAALIGLAVLSTALAYMMYFEILVRAGSANLMLVTLLIPPFAVGLGTAFLGETLSRGAVFGFVMIATGLVITDGRVVRWVTRKVQRG